MSTKPTNTRTIVITGGLGNLGSKLCRHLLNPTNTATTTDGSSPTNTKYKVILVEHPNFINPTKPLPHENAIVLPCDLGNPSQAQSDSLRDALLGADTLIHFSAVNPYPNASWSESAQSMDHTFYIFQLAVSCKVRRVILASSNHVMGGYKDDPTHGPSSIYPTSNPRIGTVPLNPQQIASSGDAKAYATAKLAGERLAMTLANLYGDTTTFVVLRIGWCQPGENLPSTLSAAGSPPEFLLDGDQEVASASNELSEDDKKDELWFKGMWLSNRDFLNYFDAAIHLNVPIEEPAAAQGDDHGEGSITSSSSVHRNVRKGFVLVNAMSKNSGAKWNLDETEKWLGVVSKDDSMA